MSEFMCSWTVEGEKIELYDYTYGGPYGYYVLKPQTVRYTNICSLLNTYDSVSKYKFSSCQRISEYFNNIEKSVFDPPEFIKYYTFIFFSKGHNYKIVEAKLTCETILLDDKWVERLILSNSGYTLGCSFNRCYYQVEDRENLIKYLDMFSSEHTISDIIEADQYILGPIHEIKSDSRLIYKCMCNKGFAFCSKASKDTSKDELKICHIYEPISFDFVLSDVMEDKLILAVPMKLEPM